MRKGILKSFVLIALALVLVFSTTVAYAAPANNKVDIKVKQLDENRIQVVEEGKVSIIEVDQISDTITEVRVYGPDNDTLILTVDRNSQTIASSQTGETVRISDIVEIEPESQTRYTSKTKTIKYSYYKIYNMISGAITIAAIAAVIFAAISGTLTVALVVKTVIKELLKEIPKLIPKVKEHLKEHGLKVTLKSYQKTVHHGHETAVVEFWKVTSIKTY